MAGIERLGYFARAGRAGTEDLLVRAPELSHLPGAKVAVFGAGCLGSACIAELARAGVGELRILDPDIVDPGTIGRWFLGMSGVGLPKVDVLEGFVQNNYPNTNVRTFRHRLGAVRLGDPEEVSEQVTLDQMTDGVSLILDTTAEVGVQHLLADVAAELKIPFVCVSGTYGGWGGRVICIRPGSSNGCWMCARWAFSEGSIPEPPSDPAGEIQPHGCGDTTFTGAGFDMRLVALTAVRTIVSAMGTAEEKCYPAMPWDVTTISLRDESGGIIPPAFAVHSIEKHPQCPNCTKV